MPFNPYQLDPTCSLNRAVIADLPGIDLPPHVKGQRAYDLISTKALLEHIRAHAEALHIDPQTNDAQLPLLFDACFDNSQTRLPAEAIAEDMGCCLGYLLLMLKRGDAVNRAARPEWDDSYWQHWGTINTIWCGGGLFSGKLGARMRDHALNVLHSAGFTDYSINISPFGEALPLVGLAHRLPENAHSALLFDFGGTAIKRAVVTVENDTLRLKRLADVPARCNFASAASQSSETESLFQYMLGTISGTWVEVNQRGIALDSPIMMSLGCYLKNGHPYAPRGCYDRLMLLADNLQRHFSEVVSERLARPIECLLSHDCTTAAAAYAGSPHTAVLMLGTALGAGFPPRNFPAIHHVDITNIDT